MDKVRVLRQANLRKTAFLAPPRFSIEKEMSGAKPSKRLSRVVSKRLTDLTPLTTVSMEIK